MKVAPDPILGSLDALIHAQAAAATLTECLRRVLQQLERSDRPMAWEVVPLSAFEDLPKSIRSCWIFVIRPGTTTSAERHPNSHQRSCSLVGNGTFEVYDGSQWYPHALASGEHGERWVSIPPSTWHRLVVGSAAWGMVSFHTVAPEDLIEEKPLDANHLDGPTHQERYAGRR